MSFGGSSSSLRSWGRVASRLRAWPLGSVLLLVACGGAPAEEDPVLVTEAEVQSGKGHPDGAELFATPFKHTNGRSCATCHVLEDHTVLTPAHVTALLASNPGDPLFNPIDADDPLAPNPTYEHLKKGLVRVVLDLPDNMDLIDAAGNVVTPPDRTVAVWRAVPTVEDTAISAPYQYDGRKVTLQEQAQGAVTAHSQGRKVPKKDLDALAEFQQKQFTSKRAEIVAKKLAYGVPVEKIERPELKMKLPRSIVR